jgi:hypothetical protein
MTEIPALQGDQDNQPGKQQPAERTDRAARDAGSARHDDQALGRAAASCSRSIA